MGIVISDGTFQQAGIILNMLPSISDKISPSASLPNDQPLILVPHPFPHPLIYFMPKNNAHPLVPAVRRPLLAELLLPRVCLRVERSGLSGMFP